MTGLFAIYKYVCESWLRLKDVVSNKIQNLVGSKPLSDLYYLPPGTVPNAALVNTEVDNFFTFFESICKVVTGKSSESSSKEIKTDQTVLASYVGIYRPLEDTTVFFKIYKEKGKLYMDLSNRMSMHMQLIAQSQTIFSIPVIKRVSTSVEFIVQDVLFAIYFPIISPKSLR